jgi:hypothetical protein
MLRSCLAFLAFLVVSSWALAQDKPNCVAIQPVDCNALAQSISCDVPHDTRECNRCFISLFGKCQARGNDPACEAAKAAQNQMYSIKKGQCEAEKAVRKAQCEATNVAINEASCK